MEENVNNIKDLAARMGLSVTTVSRVLNDKSEAYRISPATSEKVLNAARVYNYSPNRIARGLRLDKTETIGLIIPVVVIDRYFPEYRITYITTDNYAGAFMATEYFIRCGHKIIACIQGLKGITSSNERVNVLFDAIHSGKSVVEKINLKLEPRLIIRESVKNLNN